MSSLAGLPPLLAAWNWEERPSASDLEVKAGDLWVLSWDGNYWGLACIAAVRQRYVLGWPVTLPQEPAFAPALVVDRTPVTSTLLVWPTRETGLGMHLLHRPLGRLIHPARIQRIAWALEDGEDPGLPFARGSAADPSNSEEDAAFVQRWAELCFHTWPESTPRYLSETRIKNAGGTAMRAAECLGMTPPELRPLWTGAQAASDDQLNALAADLEVEPSKLLADDPMHEAVERLAMPLFKDPLLALASRAGITEGAARARARGQYALAARNDSLKVGDSRLLDAIKRASEADD